MKPPITLVEDDSFSEPWDSLDYILGKARDALAVIGAFPLVMFLAGYSPS